MYSPYAFTLCFLFCHWFCGRHDTRFEPAFIQESKNARRSIRGVASSEDRYFHLFSWSGLVMNWNLHRACAVVDVCCSAAACLFHSWMNRDSVAQYSIKQEYFCGLFRVSTAQTSFTLDFLTPRNRYATSFRTLSFLYFSSTRQPFAHGTFFSLCSICLKAYYLIHLNSDLLPSLIITRSAFASQTRWWPYQRRPPIALFRSRTSSVRNRALLCVGATDSNVDTAVVFWIANRTKAFGRRFRGQLLNSVVRWRMEQGDTKISMGCCTISSITRVRLKLMVRWREDMSMVR